MSMVMTMAWLCKSGNRDSQVDTHLPWHPCGLSWGLATLCHPSVPCLAPVNGK